MSKGNKGEMSNKICLPHSKTQIEVKRNQGKVQLCNYGIKINVILKKRKKTAINI